MEGQLIRIFPRWFIAAAEHHDVFLGQVMRFSPTLWFFPDCHFAHDSTTYRVPLFVDIDSVIMDLLAHPPGSFHFPGAEFDVPSDWNVLSTQQVQDCLWYALDDWFSYFDYRAEFAITWREFERGGVPGDLRVGCHLESFSSPHNIQFLTDLDADHT